MALVYLSLGFNDPQLRANLFHRYPLSLPPPCISLKHHIISSVNKFWQVSVNN